MGSGHFLVNLVDYLADRVITAMAEAEATVDGYLSPLTARIDVIRNTIIDNAEDRGWTINADQLDDRHIVRRMVLKRCPPKNLRSEPLDHKRNCNIECYTMAVITGYGRQRTWSISTWKAFRLCPCPGTKFVRSKFC